MADNMYARNDDDQALLRAIMLAENVSRGEEGMKMTGSSIMKRLQSGRKKEFGGSIKDVIYNKRSPYYGTQNKVFKEAMAGKIGNLFQREHFDLADKIAGNYISGKEAPQDVMFFFTPKEVENLKKSKGFDFSKVRETGENSGYKTFSY